MKQNISNILLQTTLNTPICVLMKAATFIRGCSNEPCCGKADAFWTPSQVHA